MKPLIHLFHEAHKVIVDTLPKPLAEPFTLGRVKFIENLSGILDRLSNFQRQVKAPPSGIVAVARFRRRGKPDDRPYNVVGTAFEFEVGEPALANIALIPR